MAVQILTATLPTAGTRGNWNNAIGLPLSLLGMAPGTRVVRALPNTPMLGALVKATGVLEFEPMMKAIKQKLGEKFRGGKEKFVEPNLVSVRRAYEEVRC